MDISVSLGRPDILCEQKVGTVLVCHHGTLCDAVLMRVFDQPSEPDNDPDSPVDVVVLACSDSPGESRHIPPGLLLSLPGDSPVTALLQVERAFFRAPAPDTFASPPD